MQGEENGAADVLAAIAAANGGSEDERNSREREKNRKAQARFRERQKVKNCEVERRMGELQTAVQKLNFEKNALLSKADMLERDLINENGSPAASQKRSSDGLQLQAKFGQFVKFYKQGIQDMAPLLIQCQLQPDSDAAQLITKKWKQLVADAMMTYNDDALRALACNRPLLLEEGQPHPCQLDKADWRRLIVGLHLTAQQLQRCREVRQWYQCSIFNIMTERKQLNGKMQDARAPDLTSDTQVAQYAARTLESVKRLRVNLRREQKLQTDLCYELFMKVLTPLQAVTIIVRTAPWIPDQLAILGAVAEREAA